MKCVLGHPQCQYEFQPHSEQVNWAYKRAEELDTSKSPFGIPSYPYVWRADRMNASIRLEMGHDINGKRIVATFTFRARMNAPGTTAHIAVWLINEELARRAHDIKDEEWVAHFSMNTNYHLEAFKHFKGTLLKMPLGTTSYVVAVPQEAPFPPSDDETALPPPSL